MEGSGLVLSEISELGEVACELLITTPTSFLALYGYCWRELKRRPDVRELFLFVFYMSELGHLDLSVLDDRGRKTDMKSCQLNWMVDKYSELVRSFDSAYPVSAFSFDEMGLWSFPRNA